MAQTTTRVDADEHATHVPVQSEARQRAQFGGFNLGAAFFGWLVANSVSVLLVALLSAIGVSVALTGNTNADDVTQNLESIGIVGAILLLLAIAIAYYAGGYVAGRMSRFDGGRQGFGVWVFGVAVTILFVLLGAILGANFNLLSQFNLPTIPVDGSTFTVAGLITLIVVVAVSIAAAIGGGKAGENYHRKVDRAARETV